MKTKFRFETLILAGRRVLVHALMPVLMLAGAGMAAGQEEEKGSLEIPKFFTDHFANGMRTQTGDEFWRANHFVDERIIAAIETVNDDEYFAGTSDMAAFSAPYRDSICYHKDMVGMLLAILNDPQTHRLAKCCTAAYLGVMRAPEAAGSLAANITNTVPPNDFKSFIYYKARPYVPACGSYEPVADALVAIGTPAIPAVIQNLEESDDSKIRELSLKVLVRIENDNDIVQLRLQKALVAETDATKQSRLKLALESLVKNPSEK